MFDLGWSEMLVVAILVIIVVGPKEIPTVLKAVTGMMAKGRELTRQFRSGVDELMREANIDADVDSVKSSFSEEASIRDAIGELVDPDQSLRKARRDSDSFDNPFSAPQSAVASGAKGVEASQDGSKAATGDKGEKRAE